MKEKEFIFGIFLGLIIGFCIGGAVFDKSKSEEKKSIENRLIQLETKMAVLLEERKMEKK